MKLPRDRNDRVMLGTVSALVGLGLAVGLSDITINAPAAEPLATLTRAATEYRAQPAGGPVPHAQKIKKTNGIASTERNPSELSPPIGSTGLAPKLPRQKVKLVRPPFAHTHDQTSRHGPRIIEFTLSIQEKEVVIDEAGTKFQAMTFNGSMPGPLMIVHEGDYVELTLVNPATNTMPHNIDFHSATGALGGAALTLINPGEQAILRWKATRPGVFVYHCAPEGSMIPWHVVAGMHGAVMVLPRDGLKDAAGNSLRYDRVYYVGEHDLYVPRDEKGKYKTYGSLGDSFPDTMELMRKLIPTHVVFNGKVGALTGKNALTAKVGETVLIIHSQANRDTRPHLIGGHGDYVWETGKFRNSPEVDLETWFVRGGSAGAALYTFRHPGIYAYVNHNLIEAVELGATAHFKVEGEWNSDLMKQVSPPGPIPSAAKLHEALAR